MITIHNYHKTVEYMYKYYNIILKCSFTLLIDNDQYYTIIIHNNAHSTIYIHILS